MRILVTGASGYIGRHLVPKLVEDKHEVWGTFRDIWAPRNTPNTYWYSDLSEPGALDVSGTGMGTPDVVIHLAGRVEISLLPNPKGAHLPPVPGPCDIGALYRDNVLATANVLDYCLKAGVKHLIFASSQSVYGWPTANESGGWETLPLEQYAASKLAAETMLQAAPRKDFQVHILRIGGVYGGDRRAGLVYKMLSDAARKAVITLDLPHPLPLQLIHIEDAINAIQTALPLGKQRYYMGSPSTWDIVHAENCSVNALAQEVSDLIPECRIISDNMPHPVMSATLAVETCLLKWHPKPRKERLAQVLEEIRRDTEES